MSGKCATKGTTIELNENDLPPSYTSWPTFHNAVASSLSVSFLSKPADAWYAYSNKKFPPVGRFNESIDINSNLLFEGLHITKHGCLKVQSKLE